jgi:hypothetical protein
VKSILNKIPRQNLLPIALLTLIIVFFISINTFNIKQPILEEHSFRQTQTAITAFYINKNEFKFDYETPVVGEPWSIPFEFPIFQYLAVFVSKVGGISLTASGRLVNLIFTLASCLPIWFGLRALKVNSEAIYFALLLFLSAPVYLFWAGTFMIEGAALFFTLTFIYYAIKLINGEYEVRSFILMALFMVLATLQKVTTLLPPLLVVTPIIFLSIYMDKGKSFYMKLRYVLALSAIVLLSLSIGYIWVSYTDITKAHNLIGNKLTSTAIKYWNYGTLDQRLSADFWVNLILMRSIWKSSFAFLGILVTAYFLIFVKDKKIKRIVLASLLLFMLPFMFFANLHMVHNYYQSSNLVFLCIAVGISLSYSLSYIGMQSVLFRYMIICFFLASNIYYYYSDYFPKKLLEFSNHRTILISDYLRSSTDSDDRVIWLGGFDWSSEGAFYSQRKSLTVPAWSGYERDAVLNPQLFFSKTPGAIVLCPSPSYDEMKNLINSKYPKAVPTTVSGCLVFIL